MRSTDFHDLVARYDEGGPVNTFPDALKAVREAIGHLQNDDHESAGNTLRSSAAAMAHPEIAHVARSLGAPGFDQGGPVAPPKGSSPGTPGMLGAIHDMVSALHDYFIESPRREIAAARQAQEDAQVAGTPPK